MRKYHSTISKKINIVLGITAIEIMLFILFSIVLLERNKSFTDNLIHDIAPGNLASTELFTAVLSSKSLIKNWVFVDLKSNTPEKKKLKILHYQVLPNLLDEFIKHTAEWNQEEKALIHNIVASINDSLIPQHLYIMNTLNQFDDYSNPMIMMQIMPLVEQEDDYVIALTNRILKKIETVLAINRKKILDTQKKIEKSIQLYEILLISFGVLLFLLTLYSAFYLSKILTKPINKLISATRTISRGNLDVQVSLNTKDDIQELGDNFNQMTKALSVNEKRLKESNRTKDKFFEIIAHDLRSPFNAFVSVTEMLKNNYDSLNDVRKKAFIQNIYDSSLFINSLIDNLLQWAKTQNNQLLFSPTPTNLPYLINHTIELLKNQARQKEITIIHATDKSIITEIDVNLIKTVLRNLISNAIKFSPPQSNIHVYIEEKKNDDIQVFVKDHGIGLTQEDIKKLFRIDINTKFIGNTYDKGSGLGLILCKDFIEMHHGNIYVESEVNKGSIFSFSIPKKQNKDE